MPQKATSKEIAFSFGATGNPRIKKLAFGAMPRGSGGALFPDPPPLPPHTRSYKEKNISQKNIFEERAKAISKGIAIFGRREHYQLDFGAVTL